MDSRPPGDTMNCDLIKKETITMDKYVCDICGVGKEHFSKQ